ncbi:SLOG family protein [Vulcanococcus limneticus]|uniref:SLOG family protein n=1 Tax=Vulcanococcus limneticus TaxID=2170428 RepID=UPI00398BFD24
MRASSLRSLVIVAGGGRDLDWPSDQVATTLRIAVTGRPVQCLLHGGARGADAAIDQAASRLGWPVEILRPQWSLYGRGAGPVRNRQMLQRACQLAAAGPSPGQPPAGLGLLVIAFPGGAGTASLLHQAHRLQGHSPLPIELIDLAVA